MKVIFAIGCSSIALTAAAQELGKPSGPAGEATNDSWWNFHAANTDVGDLHPSFPAKYSGPNSLNSHFESDETISVDLYGGLRLWRGAEFHMDALAWQGYGLSHTFGVEAFPSAAAYKVGARIGNFAVTRAFIRQTFNFDGNEQPIADDPLHLAGTQSDTRIVLTVGEISLLDIFDNNAYASDPSKQFMSWALVGNEAWDYPANSLGFTTGLAGEFYRKDWTVRYGFFQVPAEANGLAIDKAYTKAWGMVTELERRFHIAGHPGAARFLAYLNSARMGSYAEAVDDGIRPANIFQTQTYRIKYGFCLNIEQEIYKDIGFFTRLGWSDGHTQAWEYSDVDDQASMGVSINGELWKRPNDTYGLAGAISAASKVHQQFLEDGGLGILAGDGTLNYGVEQELETYYNFQVYKNLHLTADYQFIINSAFNRDRGPVSVLGGRVHWEF